MEAMNACQTNGMNSMAYIKITPDNIIKIFAQIRIWAKCDDFAPDDCCRGTRRRLEERRGRNEYA
jgi:hypothetical protein